MCDRFVLPRQEDAEREFTPAQCWWKFTRSFNVAFPQYVPAMRRHEGAIEAVMMRWGLVPALAEGEPVPNERPDFPFEWLEKSPDTRDPWLAGRRCIVPMAGFYAWQLTAEKYRQPYYVTLLERSVFGVAAVWERSETPDGDVIESLVLLTVPANALMTRIEPERGRMPAILRRRDYDAWFSATPARAKGLLSTYPAEWMLAHPVSPRVNSPRQDDPDLIRPVA